MRRRQAYHQAYLEQEKVRQVVVEPVAPVAVDFICHCGREFKSEQGLKVHKTRAHK